MLPSRSTDDPSDRGSASLEFLAAGLILLVPIVYLVVALGAVQNAALGTEATARFVARTVASGAEVTPELVRESVADAYGLDAATLEMSIDCVPAAADCPAAGTTIVVTVGNTAPLPLVPEIFGLAEAMSIPVDATSVYRVERLAEG
ncbi:TadE family protein [Microbacterium karelineae]|uniref:TadE family protein n=1 Tax=Microbacterium karelineae TaxID=2654283 RepID=UPI0012E9FEEE|nr:TadE family protein [Microbacterium karelineae]